MPLSPISLGVQSNPGRHQAISDAHLINCYVEDAGEEGKTRTPIVAADGFSLYSTLAGGGAIRAGINFDDAKAYVVSGDKVFRIYPVTGTATEIGTVSANGRVSMVRNRKAGGGQVGIATSSGFFYVIENDVLTPVSLPPDAPGTLRQVITLDGFFVLIFDNGEFYLTAIDEGTSIDDLDFSEANKSPDGLVGGAVLGSDAILFGDRSTEFWQNTGHGDFALERTTAASFGCYAGGSIANMSVISGSIGETVAFAGTDSDGAYLGVMLLNGYSAQKISNHAVDRAIRDEPDKSSIVGFSWAKDGHSFYCISGSSFSWLYDTATGLPHERKSTGLNRWRISMAMPFDDEIILGDYETNKLYKLRHDIHDEDGNYFDMRVKTPNIHAWPNPMRFHALHLDVIPGVGLENGAESDINPVISMRHSNDNGNRWIGPRTARLGKSGEKARRVKYLQLGMSHEDGKVFELTMSSRTVRGIAGAAINADTVQG